MTWDEWLVINQQKIEHIAGFEAQFVNTVLRHIPEIEPSDVISQYHFSDFKNGNRYIDFMIINPSKGFALPIELDGLWKVQNYADFNDMLERQNALITKYGILLRFTNKQMLNTHSMVINNIRQVLQRQKNQQSTDNLAKAEMQETILDYQNKLDELNKQLKANQMTNQNQHNGEIKALQDALNDLEKKVNGLQPKTNSEPKKSVISFPAPIAPITTTESLPLPRKTKDSQLAIIGFFGLVAIGGGLLAYNSQQKEKPTSVPTQSVAAPTIESPSTTIQPISNQTETISTPTPQPAASVAIAAEPPAKAPDIQPNLSKEPAQQDEPVTPVIAKETEPQVEKPVETAKPEPMQTNSSNGNISASEAHQHIGEKAIVCGDVAQVKEFSKGYYLNLGNSYPKQDATVVVWSANIDKFDSLPAYEGNPLCVDGMISSYKGVPQIELHSPSQIQN